MTQSNRDNREFVELAIRCLDGLAGPKEFEALDEQLRSDAEKVRLYNDLCLQVHLLEDDADQLPPTAHRAETEQRRDAPSAMRRWQGWTVAAALAIGILAGVSLAWFRQGPDVAQRPAPTTSDEFVATLIDVGDDAVWSKNHVLPRRPGEGLEKGWMRLDAGTIEMAFRSGATVRLEGPALFGIDSPLRGFLEYGRAKVHAPDEARNFVVATSAVDVVDLGTRFDVAVDQASRQVEVEVTEGLVDLHLGGDGVQPRIHPMQAGLSVQVDASGRITSIEGEALNPEHGARPSLLAHWMLDDATESGEVLDASDNKLHGTLNVNSENVTTSGKAGRAFDLGNDAYVDISKHIEALTETSSFTFSAWIYDSYDMIFSLSDGTPQDRVQFELHPGQMIYGWRQGDEFDDIRARVPSWEKGRWYHVAVSVSGTTVTIYRDGHAVATRSTGSKINSRTMVLSDVDHPTHAYIGFLIKNHNGEPQYLRGKIDDVQFYRRGLDERAIRYLYEHPGETYREASANPLSQKQP
jgi:hypothetical protein